MDNKDGKESDHNDADVRIVEQLRVKIGKSFVILFIHY